jgi:hypothetical protein
MGASLTWPDSTRGGWSGTASSNRFPPPGS